MAGLLYKELTGSILRAYYTLYNGTSRTYPEYIYENGMARLMGKMKVRYRRQQRQAEYEPDFRAVDELPDGLLYPETTGEVLGTAVEVHRALGQGIRLGVLTNFYATTIRPVFIRV